MLTQLIITSAFVLGLIGCAGASKEVADNPDSGGNCASREALLAGVWITPKGSTTASDHYNLVTYKVGGGVHVYQYAYGATNTVDYQAWRISGTSCNQIELKYNGAWMSDYSIINELSASTLDIVATDGTYYGSRSQYDRVSSGYASSGQEAPTGIEKIVGHADFRPMGLAAPVCAANQP